MEEKYITTKELMEMLHIGRDKAYELLQTNVIKSVVIGRNYRIPMSAVKSYLTRNEYR